MTFLLLNQIITTKLLQQIYNKQQQPKSKMTNSLELISGPNDLIQKKYEKLSNIVTEYNGKIHGSQSHIVNNANSISLIVYYEV